MNESNPKPEAGNMDSTPEIPTLTVESTGESIEGIGSPGAEAANEGEIEKLQEMLFGNQLRAINQKIMLVHKDFKQSIAELERKLDQQIKTETGTLKNIYENASVQMLSSSNDAHDKISILEQAQAGAQANLDERLTTLNLDVESKLQALSNELQVKIDNGVEMAKQDDTYRAALSDLLGGISAQVSALEAKAPASSAALPASASLPEQEPPPARLNAGQ